MNILSIDVGIKNLAYCLFQIKNDTLISIISKMECNRFSHLIRTYVLWNVEKMQW